MTTTAANGTSLDTRLEPADAVHLLRRLCFAAPRADVDRFAGTRLGDALDAIFDEARSTAVDDAIELLLPTGEIAYLQAWWMEQMLGTPGARCAESVALMWHDHFATSQDKVRDVHLMHRQYRLWRDGGLGRFDELLHAAVVDPAMLVWLDGVDNEKGRPNENLARELMELFALGVGNYDETDVQAAARALSGWRVVRRTARFEPRRHDDGEVVLFGESAALDAPGVVERVLARPACPRFVAHRLWTHLVSRAPDAAESDDATEALVANGWNVGDTLRHIATRTAFWAPTERAARIASPVEFVVRAVRETDAHLAPKELASSVARMGQALFRPPSVKGWDGGRRWIDSTSWIARQRFAARVAEVAPLAPDGDPVAELLPHHARPTWSAPVASLSTNADEPLRLELAAVLASAEYHLQ